MNHVTEEQLILHYYGEEAGEPDTCDALAIEQHLEECADCRSLYGSLQRVLNIVDSMPVPERPADYGTLVWERIRHKIPARRRGLGWLPAPWRWAAAGVAFAGLLVTAFLAGRSYPGPRPSSAQMAASRDPQTSERVLRAAVGDYLERSQMVLAELTNTDQKGVIDISDEQERADDLVTETRLYRQTATRTGDTRIAGLLDELERVLVDIRNSPSQVTPADLEAFRRRLESEGILFKIRVLGANVRNQEQKL
ncbi:MAG TPA: hypothetical protein VMJ75_30925 [Candidatus Acidoferrales bacterium]|nr:hypothetical protein [Candidatus Acidoferrales bacterium]